jgi:hypothetical protein
MFEGCRVEDDLRASVSEDLGYHIAISDVRQDDVTGVQKAMTGNAQLRSL